MKWLLLFAVAGLLLIILRYLNRDRNQLHDIPFELTPIPEAITAIDMPEKWSARTPISPDEFYSLYYGESDLDREFIRQVLVNVARAGGVPSELIRPEDRLSEFPGKSMMRGIKLLLSFLAPAIANAREKLSGVAAPFKLETVDDIIRHMEPRHGDLFQHVARARWVN